MASASPIRIDREKPGDAARPVDPAWVRWLTRPADPENEAIRPELTRLLYTNRSSVLFATLCLLMVLGCYGFYFDWRVPAVLVTLFIPAAVLRYRMIGHAERVDSPTRLLAASLYWSIIVGAICGEGARTTEPLLMILSGLVVVAVGFGGAYNNAGAPRFATLQTILFITPYTLFAGLSGMPGMPVILLQLPLWLIGIVMMIFNMHRTHAQLIRAENKAQHLAFHDSLTSLPNRAQFMNQLSSECTRVARPGGRTSYVLYLDLDGFKPVNDTYGHTTGDDLLRAVAERLSVPLRPGDLLGRLGGDEFAVILRDTNAAQAAALGESLIAAARAPFHLEDRPPITIGVSIGGVALAPSSDVRHTLHVADTMLYAAKRAGKGTLRIADAA